MDKNIVTWQEERERWRNIFRKSLEGKDYRIEENGIWISKKALEEVRDYYCKVCKEHAKSEVLDWSAGVDLGKRDILNDILKCFNDNKVTGA